jgi:hypothetical protein
VFDVTDKDSFRNVDGGPARGRGARVWRHGDETVAAAWLENVREYARKDVDVMLVGNKVDLEKTREIDFKTAKVVPSSCLACALAACFAVRVWSPRVCLLTRVRAGLR